MVRGGSCGLVAVAERIAEVPLKTLFVLLKVFVQTISYCPVLLYYISCKENLQMFLQL